MKEASVFKIITVCRIVLGVKGLDRIVWCAKKMKDVGRDFLWTIVGDGPDFEAVKNMIDEHGLSEQVVMIGNRLNPLPFIKLADAFCMPSRYEGKPMVITESMILVFFIVTSSFFIAT
jgi:glycosyltransferase involved in cell wall biosynthesis